MSNSTEGLNLSEAIYFFRLYNNCCASGLFSISVVKSTPDTKSFPFPIFPSKINANLRLVNQSSITRTTGFK